MQRTAVNRDDATASSSEQAACSSSCEADRSYRTSAGQWRQLRAPGRHCAQRRQHQSPSAHLSPPPPPHHHQQRGCRERDLADRGSPPEDTGAVATKRGATKPEAGFKGDGGVVGGAAGSWFGDAEAFNGTVTPGEGALLGVPGPSCGAPPGHASSTNGGGTGSIRCGRRGRRGPVGRPRPLLLPLLLAAALPGLLVSGPCSVAAEWSWVLAKSRAASGAIGPAAAAAAPAGPGGWSFNGLLPYGWRKHGSGAPAAAAAGDGSGSSSFSKTRGAAGKAGERHVGGGADAAAAGDGDGVTLAAGVVPVLVNPAGNVSELLAYDPNRPPPPSPMPPGPPGSRKPKTTKHRRREPSPGSRVLSDAQLALRELLTAPASGRPSYDPMKPHKLPAVSYKASDFVFATGSHPARYILAQSTRCWRRGIRAFIAVNDTKDVPHLNEENRVHNEHYAYFPDDGTPELGPLYHGSMAGDTRAAMAPFLANEHFGETYKWMLYGDDDTLFYMPAVKRLLAHLDPELPIAISDNFWFKARHPNLFAPRCLPCHLAVDADPPPPAPAPEGAGPGAHEAAHKPLRIPDITSVMEGYQRFLLGVRSASDMQSAKVQKLLAKSTFGDFNKSLTAISHLPPDASVPGVRYVPRPACPFCTAEAACTPTPPTNHNVSGAGCFASGGHGGAGMIFSVGLLRRLPSARMLPCFLKIIKAPGGDGMLSACLWEAGYAFTDPGASTLARYDGNYLMFSSEAGKWALHDPLTVVLKGKCDARCKWLLRNAASHHGRGRHFQNFEQSAAYLYGNMASYTATHKWLAFMAGRDGDLAELARLAEAEAAEAGGDGGDGAGAAAGGGAGDNGGR